MKGTSGLNGEECATATNALGTSNSNDIDDAHDVIDLFSDGEVISENGRATEASIVQQDEKYAEEEYKRVIRD